MKKLLVLLLMMLLPLQAAWSAAAVFCQHETTAQGHWGHHQHEVDAGCAFDQIQQTDGADNATLALDQTNNNDDATVQHQLNFASHSDHLHVNQHAIKQQHSLEPIRHSQEYALLFNLMSAVFYQSPILDQPEPPLWSAQNTSWLVG